MNVEVEAKKSTKAVKVVIATIREAIEQQRWFSELSPEKTLLFKHGKNYHFLNSFAEKAAPILGLETTKISHNGISHRYLSFSQSDFKANMAKLVDAGMKIEVLSVAASPKNEKWFFDQLSPAKKAQVKQKVERTEKVEKAVKAVKAEKSAKASTKKTATKTEKKAKTEKAVKAEASEKKVEVKEAKAVRPPQMITPNGEKVTHAHFFQSRDDVAKWFFTAKIDGVQLHLKVADPEDLVFAQKCKAEGKPFPVEELMAKYYPTKVASKVTEKDFSLPFDIEGVNGKIHTVTKLNPYKEKNIDYQDFGKWKMYACIDGKSVSIVPSKEIMSAYFDRTMSLKDIVIGSFGEKLQLPEAYKHLQKPEGLEKGAARIHKVAGDDKHWYISAKLGENLNTPAKPISFDDAGSYFSKAVTADQLAAKYLSAEIESGLAKKAGMGQEIVNSNSLKV